MYLNNILKEERERDNENKQHEPVKLPKKITASTLKVVLKK